MPLTGYILSEVETHYTNEETDKPDREQALSETVQSRVHSALNEVGYTITKDKKEDGTQPITIVSSDAKEPVDNQLQSQYSSDYMSAQGFSQADIENVRKIFGYEEADDAVKYKESTDNGLTVDDQNKPILPVTVKADEKNIMLCNKRFFKPSEAWHAIGVLKPPVWTTKQGANYVPWPKFGK